MPWLVKLRWISTSKPGICWRNYLEQIWIFVSSLNLFTKLANILQHCGHAGNIPALNITFNFRTKKTLTFASEFVLYRDCWWSPRGQAFSGSSGSRGPRPSYLLSKTPRKQKTKSSRVWGVWERVCPRVRPVNDWMSEWDPFWVINRDSPKAGRGLPKVQTQHICMN